MGLIFLRYVSNSFEKRYNELVAEGYGFDDENKTFKDVLPKNYASPNLDKRVLGDVVDLFTNMDMDQTTDKH